VLQREEPAGRPSLVVIRGQRLGAIYHLDGERELTIGRDPAADIPVTDGSVSRRHAGVMLRGGRVLIRDLGSRNGTEVGKRLVTAERELREGDKIRVGSVTIFKFAYIDEIDEAYQRQMLDAARMDPLIGVLNRRGFDERLEAESAAALRHGGPLSLLVIDIDHFKSINDSHGHPAGDALLKAVVGALAKELRREDTLARYGGDELVVILRNTNSRGAAQLAERLRQQIADSSYPVERATLHTTISVGVAELEAGGTADQLLEAADAALYRAKEAGRNRVVLA
jgi:diguanylate cyclase (GGDEF)-like protein